ncbi:MAG: IS3 family transposase [Fidelibacterota bacterium]
MDGNYKYSVEAVCSGFGYSRQAYYQKKKHLLSKELKDGLLLHEIQRIRQRQPRIGGKKLYHRLSPFMKEIGLKRGRDRFFDFLRQEGLLVERRKKYISTTDSRHHFRKYPNKIKGLKLTSPNQVYVADITYIRTLKGFCYLSLLTDAYSRKIVGYDLSLSLSIEGSIRTLGMALGQLDKTECLIHHSDRGVQYCSYDYTGILRKSKVKISMTEENHVYENALAERVNGILKEEFMLGETLASYQIAKKMVQQAVEIYNNERPHQSLKYDTPAMRHAA